ncbi:olfactory receptor 52B2-like [Pleurodeles waltl]|uniref:olfactory receptor 52B2-like n=1 Tax=Pleurodeles waltl TaxID=8319 RepID=UPI0037097A2E
MYLVSCLGNSTLAAVIVSERSLHKPMYINIFVLALVDLSLSGCIIPKVMAILWFDSNIITVEACLIQMFFFYNMQGSELYIFTLMSYDRCVSICRPLRYPTMITNSFTIQSLLFFITWDLVLLCPIPYLTTRLQYCKSNIVLNAFCEHLSVTNLACGDMTPNNIYMYLLVCINSLTGFMLVAVSYFLILRVVLKLRSSEARKKAFGTCTPHIIVMMFFHLSSLFSFLVYLFSSHVPMHVQVITSVLNSLLLPMLNPIVYGIRMKEIRQGLKKLSGRIGGCMM